MPSRFFSRPGDGTRKQRLPRGTMIALISFLCITVIGSDLYQTWSGRSREIEDSKREVQNLAWSSAQQAEGAFRLANASLIGVVERLEADGTGPAQLERLRRWMAIHMSISPILQGMSVIDEDGFTSVNTLQAIARISVADRAFFQYHLRHADRLPYFSELIRSRVSGNWVVAVSRRFNHADGSFAGVATASVDVRYFQNFFATFDIGHDGSAALLRDDGELLARQPPVEGTLGANLGRTILFRDLLPRAATGTYEHRSQIDDVLRIIAWRRVAGYPLVVVVAVGEDEMLANWRAAALQHLGAAIVVLALLGIFAVRLARQMWQLARAEQAAVATNARLEQLARHLARARDQAEQASKAKSRFLTGMTHELRTPLHGILGYAEMLGLEGGLNPTQMERVAAMMAAGEHLLSMINSVLDVAQIEADRLELHPDEIQLTDFARSCLDVVRPRAEAKGLALILTAPGPLRAVADPMRLRQVLINLLGNAIKFTRSGSIELRLGQTDGGARLRLEVTDTGPGIQAQHRDKLFQTFERLDGEAVSAIEGSGVGLALAARLVECMGGQIGYADNPGGGSVFWLELPASLAAPVTSEVAASSPRPENRSLRVLVVDDEALNRNIASGFLRFGGHEVVCVDNGAEAVELATAEHFDVILMDVRMPGMNGLEATRRIRALHPPHGVVPVVAVTAQAFAEQIEICRQAGMDTHVSKPFTKSGLLAAMENLAPASTTHAASVSTEPGISVFDRGAFEDCISILPSENVEVHLRTLIARCEAMSRDLRAPGMLARGPELAETAHGLAGAASMLGFLALGQSGRRFEVAADSGAEETAVLAEQLAAAVEAAVAVLHHEIASMTAGAA